MKRKELTGARYIVALFITILVFIIGILVGNMISSSKMAQIGDLNENMQITLLTNDLELRLLEDSACKATANLSTSSEQLFTIGEKLGHMEAELGKTDKDVLRLKEYYHLLEIRDFLFIKNKNKKCNNTIYSILYFYSNKGDCDGCDEQGAALDILRKKYKDINVYSFDVNIDNPSLNTLKMIYDIRGVPSTVINDETFLGLKDKRNIERELKKI